MERVSTLDATDATHENLWSRHICVHIYKKEMKEKRCLVNANALSLAPRTALLINYRLNGK